MKLLRLSFAFLAAAAAGCGDAGPKTDPAVAALAPTLKEFQSLANNVRDKAGDAAAFAELFAEAPPEKDRAKYSGLNWNVESFPSGSETEATVKVTPSDKNGTELAPLDWKFRKVGDKWKIASAPLPSSDKPKPRQQQQDRD